MTTPEVGLMALALLIYALPGVLAHLRKHNKRWALSTLLVLGLWVVLFFSWKIVGIGWIVMMIWALVGAASPPKSPEQNPA